jgi:Flp pilus assembly protein TadG
MRRNKRNGVILVQFALLTPLLVAMFIGCVVVADMLYTRQVCTNAAGVAGMSLMAGEFDSTAEAAAQPIADLVGGSVTIDAHWITVSGQTSLFEIVPVSFSQPAIRPNP